MIDYTRYEHSFWNPGSVLMASPNFSIPDLPDKDTVTMTFVDALDNTAYNELYDFLTGEMSDSFINTYTATQGEWEFIRCHTLAVAHFKRH